MGRCCAAWSCKRAALRPAGGRKCSRRSPLCGRLTGSPYWASIGAEVELARAVPTRDADGSLRIETRATPAILAAYKTRRYFSVEFHALSEVRTAGGVREIQRAFIEAAALVPNPEYPGVRAEVRERHRRVWL